MNRSTITLATFALVTSAFACGGTSDPAGAAAPTNAAVGTGALDGKSYEVTLSGAGEPPQKDTLVFNGGKFESTACTGFGFPRWTEYTASGDPSAIAFHVVTHHPSGGSNRLERHRAQRLHRGQGRAHDERQDRSRDLLGLPQEVTDDVDRERRSRPGLEHGPLRQVPSIP